MKWEEDSARNYVGLMEGKVWQKVEFWSENELFTEIGEEQIDSIVGTKALIKGVEVIVDKNSVHYIMLNGESQGIYYFLKFDFLGKYVEYCMQFPGSTKHEDDTRCELLNSGNVSVKSMNLSFCGLCDF